MAWVAYAVYAAITAGTTWYTRRVTKLAQAKARVEQQKAEFTLNATGVDPSDVGIGFSPAPNYPTSENPMPIVFGASRVNPMIVHQRVYGDNYTKGHYVAILGEKGVTPEDLYIDDVKITELPNYYTNTSGFQDNESSWYNFYPLGGEATIVLSNTGTFNVVLLGNTPIVHVSSQPVILYGGGTITCSSYHSWNSDGATHEWKWTIQNLDDQSDFQESQIYSKTFYDEESVNCFLADSKVETEKGLIAIEFCNIGDKALSYDDKGNLSYNKILSVNEHFIYTKLIYLTLSNSVKLFVISSEHYLYESLSQSHKQAKEIETGDVLLDKEGNKVHVISVFHRQTKIPIFTYSITVEGNATHILDGVRVHNGGGKDTETFGVPGSSYETHVFNIDKTVVRYSLKMEVIAVSDSNSQVGIAKFEIADVPYSETVLINALFVHIHLVKDESIKNNTPFISADVKSSVVSGLGGNPAQAIQTFIEDPVNGLDMAGSVDFTSVLNAAYWCELKGYGYNRVIGTYYDSDAILNEMAVAGRLMIIQKQGKLYLKPNDIESISYTIGNSEIIPNSVKVGVESSQQPNRIECQYVEPFYKYATERIYVEDLEAIARDGLQSVTLNLIGITDQTQAYKIGYFNLRAFQDTPHWCTFQTGMNTASNLDIGNVIDFEENDHNILISQKLWRVTEIEETENFIFSVGCIEYNDSVYEEPNYTPWYHDIVTLEGSSGWPVPAIINPVLNLTLASKTFPTGTMTTNIVIEWVTPPENYDSAIIEWSHNGIEWVNAGTSSTSSFAFTWPMRYGLLTVRVLSVYNGNNNRDSAPLMSTAIRGNENNDYPGYGNGQYGRQGYGY